MTLEQTFLELTKRFRALDETFDALCRFVGTDVVDDEPPEKIPPAIYAVDNKASEARGNFKKAYKLAGACYVAFCANPGDRFQTVKLLGKCQRLFHAASAHFAKELQTYERTAELIDFGLKRPGKPAEWARQAIDSIERCRQPIERVGQALSACWHKMTEAVALASTPSTTTSKPVLTGSETMATEMECTDATMWLVDDLRVAIKEAVDSDELAGDHHKIARYELGSASRVLRRVRESGTLREEDIRAIAEPIHKAKITLHENIYARLLKCFEAPEVHASQFHAVLTGLDDLVAAHSGAGHPGYSIVSRLAAHKTFSETESTVSKLQPFVLDLPRFDRVSRELTLIKAKAATVQTRANEARRESRYCTTGDKLLRLHRELDASIADLESSYSSVRCEVGAMAQTEQGGTYFDLVSTFSTMGEVVLRSRYWFNRTDASMSCHTGLTASVKTLSAWVKEAKSAHDHWTVHYPCAGSECLRQPWSVLSDAVTRIERSEHVTPNAISYQETAAAIAHAHEQLCEIGRLSKEYETYPSAIVQQGYGLLSVVLNAHRTCAHRADPVWSAADAIKQAVETHMGYRKILEEHKDPAQADALLTGTFVNVLTDSLAAVRKGWDLLADTVPLPGVAIGWRTPSAAAYAGAGAVPFSGTSRTPATLVAEFNTQLQQFHTLKTALPAPRVKHLEEQIALGQKLMQDVKDIVPELADQQRRWWLDSFRKSLDAAGAEKKPAVEVQDITCTCVQPAGGGQLARRQFNVKYQS